MLMQLRLEHVYANMKHELLMSSRKDHLVGHKLFIIIFRNNRNHRSMSLFIHGIVLFFLYQANIEYQDIDKTITKFHIHYKLWN